MAVRRAQRKMPKQRSEYVYSEESMNSSPDEGSSSEENGSGVQQHNYKVRDNNSIRNLLKESHCYEKGDDHAYSQHLAGVKRKRMNTECSDSSRTVSKKKRCESKNAVNARINRERKKAYVSSLEDEIDQLKDLNKSLVSKLESKDKNIKNITDELARYKCLVANDKYLFALVNKISHVTGLPVSSSFLTSLKKDEECQPRTRSVPAFGANHPISRRDASLSACDLDNYSTHEDQENWSLFPSLDTDLNSEFDSNDFLPVDCFEDISTTEPFDKNIGICVHINQNRLSVEFCTLCNSRIWGDVVELFSEE